jgi:hypothetical protein
MLGYFLPAFVARAFAADFCAEVNVFDFFFGLSFSQIGLLGTLLPLRGACGRPSLLRRLLSGGGVGELHLSDLRHYRAFLRFERPFWNNIIVPSQHWG